jgi:hypothetical protein
MSPFGGEDAGSNPAGSMAEWRIGKRARLKSSLQAEMMAKERSSNRFARKLGSLVVLSVRFRPRP